MASLTLGSTGEDVRKLQQGLVDEGYDIAVDGILGPKTMAAHEDRQSKQPKVKAATSGTSGANALTQALANAQQQASGLGISASNVDPTYAQAMASGQGQSYTDYLISLAKQNAASNRASTTPTIQQYTPSQRTTMTLAQALGQARGELSPVYQQDVADITQQTAYDMIRRGAYGQPDSGETVAQAIAPRQAQYTSSISQLARALMEADRSAALQEQQQEYQAWSGNTNLALALQQAQRSALESDRAASFQREQFGYTKEQDALANALTREQFEYGKAQDDMANTLAQSQFDWTKSYQQQQLNLASQPQAVAPKSAWEDTLYNKLLSGQELTDFEKTYLKVDTRTLRDRAITVAQDDMSYQQAAIGGDVAKMETIVQQYMQLIQGAIGPTSSTSSNADEDWAAGGGYYKP